MARSLPSAQRLESLQVNTLPEIALLAKETQGPEECNMMDNEHVVAGVDARDLKEDRSGTGIGTWHGARGTDGAGDRRGIRKPARPSAMALHQ